MAGSSYLMMQARILLATSSHERLANVVHQLFMPRQDQADEAKALYDFCVANFPNCLTLMLLKVYRDSSDDAVRSWSIFLLSESLTVLRNRSFELSLVALNDIKPLLISCLTMPEAYKYDTKIFRELVSFVSFNVVKLDSRGWDELGDCMVVLANTNPLRAFNVFNDLPLLHEGFINRFLKKLVEEVYVLLLNPVQDRDQDWSLALETAIKLGIQLSDSETFKSGILGSILKSANELVIKGKKQVLQLGLVNLVKFLVKDSNLCRYNSKQCGFVSEFAFKIAGIGKCTEVAARRIYQMVTKLDNYVSDPAFKLSFSIVENLDNYASDPIFKLSLSLVENEDLELYNNLKTLSIVDILGLVALTPMDDRSREMAVRRVHDLLCDHTSREVEIDDSEMRQLKKLLLSCVTEVGVPENTFKILGQAVFHVAHDMLSNQEDKWVNLWDYIGLKYGTQFEKPVYIFQCLTMMLIDKDDVFPAIDNLLPEISTRLYPPKKVLVDNSCWVLAFVGAFCAAIHLLESIYHTDSVKETVDKMVDSVGELAERRMEVGLVRRAFRDLESTVKKQLDWYDASEYRFTKALLRKLYGIKGLRMESKMILWKINVNLERGTPNVEKVLLKSQS